MESGMSRLLFLAAACLFVTSCDGGHGRKRCEAPDATSCGSSESCLWVHDGNDSGYFCALPCSSDKSCPNGESCKAGAASSCATCQDLIDVCE